MVNVLVVYYTQSGLLKESVDACLEPLRTDPEVQLDLLKIEPEAPYPYPWDSYSFFDAFPESVFGIPCPLKEFEFQSEDYDLVILAYQVWYLSPSIPVNSFLLHPKAKNFLKNKKVLTLISCRNMWITAQEKVKRTLKEYEASLVGNITLVDKHSNLISVMSVIGKMLYGKGENFMGVFPAYGASEKDLRLSKEFGDHIKRSLITKNEIDQSYLVKKGAVVTKPSLLMLDLRASKLFQFWANFVSKGNSIPAGDPKRRWRVKFFSYYIFVGIFVLSPISSLLANLLGIVARRKVQEKLKYVSSCSYDESFSG